MPVDLTHTHTHTHTHTQPRVLTTDVNHLHRMLKRFAINFAVAFAYYAFFYVGLYVLKLSGRKYIEGSYPTFHNMLHNMWYWSLVSSCLCARWRGFMTNDSRHCVKHVIVFGWS